MLRDDLYFSLRQKHFEFFLKSLPQDPVSAGDMDQDFWLPQLWGVRLAVELFLDGVSLGVFDWGGDARSVQTNRKTKERHSRLDGYRNGSFVGEMEPKTNKGAPIFPNKAGVGSSYNLKTVQLSFHFVYPATLPAGCGLQAEWLPGLTPPRD